MERVKKTRRAASTIEPMTADTPASPQATADALADAAALATLAPAGQSAPATSAADKALAADDDEELPSGPHIPRGQSLQVMLTQQLHLRLARMAHEEGVSLEALVQELLAEGATLRAWEIIERKQAMRGGVQPTQTPPGSNRNFNSNYSNPNGNSRHHNGNNRGTTAGNGPRNHPNHNNHRNVGGRAAPNNAWMEDKAAFLEYVRNQEKQRRR